MKQELKSQESRNKILEAALKEFGSKDYNSATINNICSEYNISKGLIYHHFGGKDELFLICVKECFDKLSKTLKENVILDGDVRESVKSYFYTRNKFFKEQKELKQIFRSAMFQPPKHLKTQILELHKELKEVNYFFAKNIFQKLNLRKGITIQEAMDYFITYEEFFGEYFRRHQMNVDDTDKLVEFHENTIYKIFDMMLFGIAIQEEKL